MDNIELIEELAARAGVAPAEAKAVLGALASLGGAHGHRDRVPEHAARFTGLRYQPSPLEVERLIDGARAHSLGLRFLLEGDLGCVAATFRTHAFTVDAARQLLAAEARG
jgi:hypothetical protein